MNEPKPSPGRIVIYTSAWRHGEPHSMPAIITAVHEDGTVALHPFRPPSVMHDELSSDPHLHRSLFAGNAKAGTEEARGKWAWPERT